MTGGRPRIGPPADVVWDGIEALLKSLDEEATAKIVECLEGGGSFEECIPDHE